MDKNFIVIGDVAPFSIVDFPGHIAATVFMQGCPWRCPFCYNVSLQKIGGCPESDWTFEKLLAFLQKRKGVLDAVVFSGGEPLVQEGLGEALEAVKALGYQIGLHTGGCCPEMLARIIGRIDWAGLDIKAPLNDGHYQRVTGVRTPAEKIVQSLDILLKSGKPFECRTTCDPRLLTADDLYQIGESLKKLGVREYYLQKYRPVPADTETTNEMCSALVENAALNQYLTESFAVFDVRK